MEWSLSDLRDVADVLESGEYYLEANVIRKFASDVADLAKRGLKYLPSKTKWLHSQPYQLHHGDCNIEDWNNELTECKCGLFQYIAELEQIVEESA